MCTRAVYLGLEDTVITARTLDWFASMDTNLWVYPAGLRRDGNAGPDSFTWTSVYGSVTASVYESATCDGINERGLVANLLYLAESDFGAPRDGDRRKPMSIGAWCQYVLDSFATVADAVDGLRAEPFYLPPIMTPDGHPATAHLSISDPTGDSAIFEYVDGALVIHHDRAHQVMTNSPVFSQQLALNAYWETIGGATMLPGTDRAADRFVRASYYIKKLPLTSDTTKSLAGAFSVIRNASSPMGVSSPGEPNVSATLWRVVADQKNRVYYFESAESPFLIWINLDDIDLSAGQPTRKLTLTAEGTLLDGDDFVSGDVTARLAAAEPFTFLPA